MNETLAKFTIRLCTVLYILKFFTCKEENKRKISLVLYIRFEYRLTTAGSEKIFRCREQLTKVTYSLYIVH